MKYIFTNKQNKTKYVKEMKNEEEARHWVINTLDLSLEWSFKEWTPSEMGKKGGKNSAKKRFAGLTPEQISEKMKKVRNWGKKDTQKLVEHLKICEQI